jgi:outer membrane lipoprotein-sorting protein
MVIIRMHLLALLVVPFLVLTGLPARAALSGADHADIARAETYLNAVTTLKARFIQVAPDGSNVEGTVYLSRPGRMRLEYDPPSPILIIANHSWLIYHDKQLLQTSYVGIDSTPAGVLVKPQVQLDADGLAVTRVAHQPGMLDITVINKNDPAQGRITLIFTEAPFQLRQWQVVDGQGQLTTVSLFDAHAAVTLDDGLFEFHDPRNFGPPDFNNLR